MKSILKKIWSSSLAFILTAAGISVSQHAYALSPEAESGKMLFPTCFVCHNPAADPPTGPPMWGVKNQYRRAYGSDKQVFIDKVREFVQKPTKQNAVMTDAVAKMKVMPPMALPDAMLDNISAYIYETQFEPPCDHWRIEVKNAKDPNAEHVQKEKRQIKRFCTNN